MSSSSLANTLESLQPFIYGAVAAVALIQWRRRPGRASAWLAASLTVLALVVIAGRLLPEDSDEPLVLWAGKALIATLVLFPYFLYRFMTSLIPPVRWINIAAAGLTAAVAIAGLLLPAFPEEGEPRPAGLQAYIALLLIQWVFLTGRVAWRLWRVGRGLPTVARRRMRTMSLGSAGLALALVVAGEFPSENPIAQVLIQLLVLSAAPLMLIGFAPPSILRAAWREHDETAIKEAERSLVRTTTFAEVAHTLLPHARAVLGAAAVALEDLDGKIIASEDLTPDEARTLIESRLEGEAIGSDQGSIVSIPMQSGRLIAITNPFTPFFGTDEIKTLQSLAALADLALARNQLLENQERLAAIVESSDDAILTKSLEGVILDWNRGAERIYGYRAEEIIGQPIATLAAPDGEDDTQTILEKMRAGESIKHYETRRKTKDGRIIDVALTVSPIRDPSGRITGASTIARDVTEKKQLEREREVALEEAARANLAKNEFLSRMSHELRTPLNAVLGFGQLLDMDQLTDEQKDWTKEILKAGQHLLELINEVLDISRIETGHLRLSPEPVDPALAAQECISLLTPLAAEEGITLEFQGDGISSSVFVIADRQRLKQVLLNLISNGIKYNRLEGSVRVSFEPLQNGRRLKINVSDTGQGIPSTEIEQLFSPFERLGAEASGIEGTGLGLALSKGLVEAMGGTISVTSEIGKGTTFSVELATAEAPGTISEGETPSQVRTSTGPTPSRRILYIEDNLSNLKLVERLLGRRPEIEIMSAMQGGIAITLARDHKPDLILLDLDLPDMPGEEVLGRLRADPATTDIPVVVISADATGGQVRRLLDAGARDYVKKPLEVKRFLEVIDLYRR